MLWTLKLIYKDIKRGDPDYRIWRSLLGLIVGVALLIVFIILGINGTNL